MKTNLLFFSAFFFCQIGYAQWEYLNPTEGFALYEPFKTVLKIHPSTSEPYVLFSGGEVNIGSEISMKKFNGSNWEFIGGGAISDLTIFNAQLDFEFNPLNGNVPVAYYTTGAGPSQVIELIGTTWMPKPGLGNYNILTTANYDIGFDLSATGNPTLAIPDGNCQTPNGWSSFSTVRHDGSEWQGLSTPCQSPNPIGAPDLEYNDFTGELFAYHDGGIDQGNFDYAGSLLKYSGSTWDVIATPPFTSLYELGKMSTNPVTGEVYIMEWGYVGSSGNDRLFKLFVWDGTTLDSISCMGQIEVGHINWLAEVHPITGEIYILYKDTDDFLFNVKKYNGTAWVETEFSDIESFPLAEFFDMEFDPITGDLYLALKSAIDDKGYVIKHSALQTSAPEERQNTISIFPNPSTGEFTINKPIGDYVIRNITGEIVHRGNERTVNLQHLSAGIYFLIAKEGEAKLVKY